MKRKIIFIALFASLILIGKVQAAPLLVNEELVTIADDHVIITWVTTNESSTTGIKYGLVTPNIVTGDSIKKSYHYLTLTNLYPNTTYYYQIFSTSSNGTTEGQLKSFTTLARPTGQYLFSFATLTDTHINTNVTNTSDVRGRAYASSEAILKAQIDLIKTYSNLAFLIIKGDIIGDPPGSTLSSINYVRDNIKIPILDSLGKPYYPIPGNHDKSYTGVGYNWITNNLGVLYSGTGKTGADSNTDSVFNYSFVQSGYRFIMLDSLKADGQTASVETTFLASELQLAKNNNQKAFIFLHHEVSKEADIPTDILAKVLDKATFDDPQDWDKMRIQNGDAFLNLLSQYQLANGEPVVGSVFAGHFHDNRARDINGFRIVRTASGLQFPTGFNIYKVYTNGYIQSFYKTPGYSDEICRDLITGTTQVTASRAQQFYLGGGLSRNFTYTYGSAPLTVLSNLPQTATANVALNQPLIINFAKAISNQSTVDQWLTITYDGTTSFPISSSNWSWNSAGTTLTISKTLIASKNFSVNIKSTAGVAATDGTTLAADYNFTFTTGTQASGTPPSASMDRIRNSDGVFTDVTTDPTPTLTGIATDSSGSTIANVEYRYASNSWSNWLPTTPLDGAFDSATEAFIFTISQGLGRGEHNIELRTTNAAGITATSSFPLYQFQVISEKPEVYLKADGNNLLNGDAIRATPSLEIKVVTDRTLNQVWFTLNGTRQQLTLTNPGFITTLYYLPTLVAGSNDIRVEANDTDSLGNLRYTTREALSLQVQTAGDAKIFGQPLNYPNPFNAGAESTTISYMLSIPSNVTLSIFDLSGSLIAKKSYSANQPGGRSGYNEVTWDGRSDGGTLVGNGIYIYLIIVDGKVAQNGKGKIAVFKR